MNLYAYLDELPSLAGRVLTARPSDLPDTYALVREQFEANARPMYNHAALRTRQISVHLHTSSLSMSEFEVLASRVEDAVARVTEHPNVRFVSLELGAGLPAQEDPDGEQGALFAVVRFALMHHRSPGAT